MFPLIEILDKMADNYSNSQKDVTVNEGYELGNPQYLERCEKQPLPSCLQRRHSCSRWHIVLFLIVAVVIIVLVGLLSPAGLMRRETAGSKGRNTRRNTIKGYEESIITRLIM